MIITPSTHARHNHACWYRFPPYKLGHYSWDPIEPAKENFSIQDKWLHVLKLKHTLTLHGDNNRKNQSNNLQCRWPALCLHLRKAAMAHSSWLRKVIMDFIACYCLVSVPRKKGGAAIARASTITCTGCCVAYNIITPERSSMSHARSRPLAGDYDCACVLYSTHCPQPPAGCLSTIILFEVQRQHLL